MALRWNTELEQRSKRARERAATYGSKSGEGSKSYDQGRSMGEGVGQLVGTAISMGMSSGGSSGGGGAAGAGGSMGLSGGMGGGEAMGVQAGGSDAVQAPAESQDSGSGMGGGIAGMAGMVGGAIGSGVESFGNEDGSAGTMNLIGGGLIPFEEKGGMVGDAAEDAAQIRAKAAATSDERMMTSNAATALSADQVSGKQAKMLGDYVNRQQALLEDEEFEGIADYEDLDIYGGF